MKYVILSILFFIQYHSFGMKCVVLDNVKFDGRNYNMKSDILSSFLQFHKKSMPLGDVVFLNDMRNFFASYEIKDHKVFLTGIFIYRKTHKDSIDVKSVNIISELFKDTNEIELRGLTGDLILIPEIDNYKNRVIQTKQVCLHLEVRNGLIVNKTKIKRNYLKRLEEKTFREFKSTKKFEELRKYYSKCDDELFKSIIMDDIFHFAVRYE